MMVFISGIHGEISEIGTGKLEHILLKETGLGF